MTLETIEKDFDNLLLGSPKSLESWVIRRNGKIVKLRNGKMIWKKQNHAGAALTNAINEMYYYKELNKLKEDLGLSRRDSLGEYLREKGIVKIEPL